MKSNTTIVTLLANAIVAGTLLISAQGAAYMKFDGIDGEAQDKDHKEWIDVLSFSQAIHQPGGGATGQSRRRGDVILEDITCVKELDKSSPKIAEALCNGKVFPSAVVEFARTTETGRHTYLKYELKNVMVTSYSVKINVNSSGEEVPTEDFSLNFEEIKVTYTEFDQRGHKKGNVEYNWKVEEGERLVEEQRPVNEADRTLAGTEGTLESDWKVEEGTKAAEDDDQPSLPLSPAVFVPLRN